MSHLRESPPPPHPCPPEESSGATLQTVATPPDDAERGRTMPNWSAPFPPEKVSVGNFEDSGAGADLRCAPARAPAPPQEDEGRRGGGEHGGWGILKTRLS